MAKKVYYNGYVYTVNETRDVATAVVIDGNHIEYVGDDANAKAIGGRDAKLIDLEGKMMLPGFIDGHCHPIMAAHFLCGVYLEVEMTPEECLDAIREYIEEHPDQDSYFGLGYAEWTFDETGPKKEMLDAICPDKPVMILGSSGHEA